MVYSKRTRFTPGTTDFGMGDCAEDHEETEKRFYAHGYC